MQGVYYPTLLETVVPREGVSPRDFNTTFQTMLNNLIDLHKHANLLGSSNNNRSRTNEMILLDKVVQDTCNWVSVRRLCAQNNIIINKCFLCVWLFVSGPQIVYILLLLYFFTKQVNVYTNLRYIFVCLSQCVIIIYVCIITIIQTMCAHTHTAGTGTITKFQLYN